MDVVMGGIHGFCTMQLHLDGESQSSFSAMICSSSPRTTRTADVQLTSPTDFLPPISLVAAVRALSEECRFVHPGRPVLCKRVYAQHIQHDTTLPLTCRMDGQRMRRGGILLCTASYVRRWDVMCFQCIGRW
jgi:hypothetical protein